MRIGIVGGGIFGTSIAWMLAGNGFHVDLFEKEDDIFKAASGINQYRIHRGYHYPRSKETILTCLSGEKEFCETYPEAVLDDEIEHYYSISNFESLVSAEECMTIWSECGLEYEEKDPGIVNNDNIEMSLKVKELLFDPEKLKEILWEKLKKYNVNVMLNTEARYEEIKENYDLIIVATYSMNNTFLTDFPSAQRDYQFEIVEKLTLKLPKKFNKKSVVVIDGPFMCIDPFGRTGLFAMGNVVHAIHEEIIGKDLKIPEKYMSLLNKGVIKNPPFTHFERFIESAKNYFPGIENAEHEGSMFTIRTVLPYRDHDDARPTIVEKINDKLVTVFSGKIPTCIDSAKQVLNIAIKMKQDNQ